MQELSDKISSAVAGELIQVAKAANGTNTAKLTQKLQETARDVLKRMEPELKELFTLSGKSVRQVSKDLAHKINHNKALRKELSKGRKISTRSVAQMVVGWGGWGGVAMQAVTG